MNYINKPVRPVVADFENMEKFIEAYEIYDQLEKQFENQCDEISREIGIAAGEFQKIYKTVDFETSKPYLVRMDELNNIKSKSLERLLNEDSQPSIFSPKKLLTKTAIVNFRVDQEIKDKFSESCEKNNITIAEALRNAMLRAIAEQESQDRMDRVSKIFEDKRETMRANLSPEEIKKLQDLGVDLT